MLGDGTAVAVNRHHNIDPAAKRIPSVCIIDGDSQQRDDAGSNVFRLPGASPELYVYDQIVEVLDSISGVLSVALHHKYEDQVSIAEIISDVRRSNMDPHTLFSQVGKRLGLLPEATVRGAFLTVWAQSYPDQVDGVLASFDALLPRERAGGRSVKHEDTAVADKTISHDSPSVSSRAKSTKLSTTASQQTSLPFKGKSS